MGNKKIWYALRKKGTKNKLLCWSLEGKPVTPIIFGSKKAAKKAEGDLTSEWKGKHKGGDIYMEPGVTGYFLEAVRVRLEILGP